MGDCYGYVYERKRTVNFDMPLQLLQETLKEVSGEGLLFLKFPVDQGQFIYSDDTQMGLATLHSL